MNRPTRLALAAVAAALSPAWHNLAQAQSSQPPRPSLPTTLGRQYSWPSTGTSSSASSNRPALPSSLLNRPTMPPLNGHIGQPTPGPNSLPLNGYIGRPTSGPSFVTTTPSPLQPGTIIRPGLPDQLPSRRPGEPARPLFNPDHYRFVRDGSTLVHNNGAGGITTIFEGYRNTYVPSQTCVSPFGVYHQGAPYISSTYVIVSPYAYANGRELDTSALEGSYYDNNALRGQSLQAALGDIVRFWQTGDGRTMRRRVAADLTVAVFENETYRYALRRSDFLALAADALDQVDTISFRFTDVRQRSDGLVNAYATHTFRATGESAAVQRATVRYTLVYVDNDWFLSAVSLPTSSAP